MTMPAQVLVDQGYDIDIRPEQEYRFAVRDSAWHDGVTVVGLETPVNCDVAVFQRPLQRNRYEMIQAFQSAGIAVVVEIDDDFHSIHRANMAWRSTNPLENREMNRDWLKKSCAIADLVTVSTPALAERYGAHGRCVVLRNCVPEKYLSMTGGAFTDRYLGGFRADGVAVGWSGSVATHPDDLQVTGGAIPAALGGAEFVVVGTGMGVADKLELAKDPRATGWLNIHAYPEAMAMIDVGIVPLAMTQFNEAKSYLKGLEFASVGVPFVASPTGEYRRLASEGIGWVAESPADWRILVEQLVKDTAHREALSEAWRAQVAAEHTYERNASKWWDAWTWARELADGRAAA